MQQQSTRMSRHACKKREEQEQKDESEEAANQHRAENTGQKCTEL